MLTLENLALGTELHRRFTAATVENEARCVHCAISNDGTLARKAKVGQKLPKPETPKVRLKDWSAPQSTQREDAAEWLLLPTQAEQAEAYAQCRLIAALPHLASAFAQQHGGRRPILLANNTFVWKRHEMAEDKIWVLTAQRLEWLARWYAGDQSEEEPAERSPEVAKALVGYHLLQETGAWLGWCRKKAMKPDAVSIQIRNVPLDTHKEEEVHTHLINLLGTPAGRLWLRDETGVEWQLNLRRYENARGTYLEPLPIAA